MASLAIHRLRKEYKDIASKPIDNMVTRPLEENILEWHYVIEGTSGTPYEGGRYHGTITFPSEYPMKPPKIEMLTPNGRFQTHTRLCLSMSDFHPETWNPMWTVRTILLGLYSFMLEDSPTTGCIVTDDEYKKQAAKESHVHNNKNTVFCKLFPELIYDKIF
jgi:ubiquitin-conjugating enzyme E2 J2